MEDSSHELTQVDLTEAERLVLRKGMLMWSAPATMTDRMAKVLWFDSAADFEEHRDRLEDAIRQHEALSPLDWHRVLAATEVVFCCLTLGAGRDWSIITGLDDHETLTNVRQVQEKLAWVRPWPAPYARPGYTEG
jgi:hypothetical protein